MTRLLLITSVAFLILACEGTPLPGDEDDEAPVVIDPLSSSLEPSEVGIALRQLTAVLGARTDAQTQLLGALQSPSVQLNGESVTAAFLAVTGNEFEIGWLAFLLALATEREGATSETTAAAGALRALSISAYSEALAVSAVRGELEDSTVSLNQARSTLVDLFGGLRLPGEADAVVLLPEDVANPSLSLARLGSNPTLLPENTAGFASVASAVNQSTTAEIMSRQDVSISRVQIAALAKLALLTGRGSEPPSSPFGRYVLTVPVPDLLIYSLQGRETVGVIRESDLPLVALDVADDGAVGVTLLDVETDRDDLRVRSSGRSEVGQSDFEQPGFGRPSASLQSGFGRYQLLVELPFVNPANAPFRITCAVPSLGARVTMTLASRSAQGQLRASGRLVLAPALLGDLAQEPQVVCVGAYGNVETGRISIPRELIPLEDLSG